LGEFFALACALVWAVAVLFFRKSGLTVAPFPLNLFRVTVSLVLFAVTLLVLRRPLWGVAPWQDYAVLMASGVMAIAISDTLFHLALNRVGAGINAIVNALYSPFIVLFAMIMLGETLDGRTLAGMILIVTGVIITTQARTPEGMTRGALVVGILYGVASMATLALGIVFAKPVLERSDIIWATAVRQVGALAVLLPVALALPRRRARFAVFCPDGNWRFTLPGTFLGSYLALILWIGGMKLTEAGTAAILNQTSTVYILVLASIFLKEPFTRRKLLAAVLAIAGVLLVLQPID
jgi:drug/metabolite transporter (DMT)-like permease